MTIALKNGSLRLGSTREIDERPAVALAVREHIVRMAARGGGFLGASLSCADLIVHLYSRVLDIAPDRLTDPDRDYLFFSKDHGAPALYATLAELGYFERERLDAHLSLLDSIYWHPSRMLPGVELHSGAPGHLLSVGLGVALDIKLCGGSNRVFVVLGHRELDEGSLWEACRVAAALELHNLVAVVDRDAEEVPSPETLPSRFQSFGWSCRTVNGHDFVDLDAAFPDLPDTPDRPCAVIARTMAGEGAR